MKNIILSKPTLVAKYMFSKEVPDAFIESTQKIEAANVQKIIIILLSLLSEKKPKLTFKEKRKLKKEKKKLKFRRG